MKLIYIYIADSFAEARNYAKLAEVQSELSEGEKPNKRKKEIPLFYGYESASMPIIW